MLQQELQLFQAFRRYVFTLISQMLSLTLIGQTPSLGTEKDQAESIAIAEFIISLSKSDQKIKTHQYFPEDSQSGFEKAAGQKDWSSLRVPRVTSPLCFLINLAGLIS